MSGLLSSVSSTIGSFLPEAFPTAEGIWNRVEGLLGRVFPTVQVPPTAGGGWERFKGQVGDGEVAVLPLSRSVVKWIGVGVLVNYFGIFMLRRANEEENKQMRGLKSLCGFVWVCTPLAFAGYTLYKALRA